MLKGSPLLFIGLVLFLWARGMTHDDTVLVGLGRSGHLELKSATGAVSLAASPGLHKLGKLFSFEFSSKTLKAESNPHKGFKARFDAAMNWELRLPLIAVMGVVIVGLIFLMKYLKPR